jgi:hypothetical protein
VAGLVRASQLRAVSNFSYDTDCNCEVSLPLLLYQFQIIMSIECADGGLAHLAVATFCCVACSSTFTV